MTYDEMRRASEGVTFFTLPNSKTPNRRFRFVGGKGEGKLYRHDPLDTVGVWTPHHDVVDGGEVLHDVQRSEKP